MSSTPTPVPLTVMDHQDPELFAQLMRAIEEVAERGAFTGGETVERFESDFARWCETAHAVGVSSGTEALTLALRALGIGAGDEVIVPANSFIATAEAVTMTGARPRFADVDEHTQLVTAETVAAALTPAVRCVIPVHLFGRTVDLDPILELAEAEGLRVIEDAAQAHGARYNGRRVGSIADAGTFSFYPAKNLGAWGDAGAVVTARDDVAEAVALMRSHGESPRYHHRVVGTTGRLDAIQAAVLHHKLAHLERWNELRRELAELLRDALGETRSIVLPAPLRAGEDHVYHQFVIRTRQRDQLRERLAAEGIATGVHYPKAIHNSEAYAELAEAGDVAPTATRLAGEILSLPIFPSMSSAQVARVAAAVRDCAAAEREPMLAGSS
ncbi:MAG TPA: DegT/DnrJ/EryC1/StrS family aminotransferase [Solirubrobacteraceae bacterium]|nr:DegT/DnrJ/EryC1/StrS family aminotransferase [Solirubrobacteraceae bacterium]